MQLDIFFQALNLIIIKNFCAKNAKLAIEKKFIIEQNLLFLLFFL
jgi:hypothetical protein